ncbi:Hypothetical protein D9617_35g090140 [Elsinoe fawcettii]|nr:Hypothetical protein D9617_35g090140 [Elsinoe fawcettii]
MFLSAYLPLILQLCLQVLGSAVLEARAPAPFSNFNNNPVFYPGSEYTSWRTIYARPLQLPDGSLLMTWENYPLEPPAANFPIYKSTDGGATWSEFSRVVDQVNGWGLRYQPHLYTLPQTFGDYPAGTIIISGPSVPADLSKVYIDMYASRDAGKTWEFVSHIAYGDGPETVRNGDKAIWEPFFVTWDNKLICYYSDQRDPAHAQKLVHVTTTDLKTWTPVVDDVADPSYEARPGMATVAHIESTGQWAMTYENCGPAGCGVFFKVATSPFQFGSVQGTALRSNDSSAVQPYGSPFVIWTPHPARTDGSGILIANGNSREEVFINEDSAEADGWKIASVGQWSAYSRALTVIDVQGKKKLLLSNGGNMGPGENNFVACGVVDIPY